jgi:hypothetical protein
MAGMDSIADVLASKSKRPRFKYKVPAKSGTAMTDFVLVQLALSDELEANKRATQSESASYEMLRASLVEVDGTAVTFADGSVDEALNKAGPKGRQIVARAVRDLHNASDDIVGNVLASVEVLAG